ncbi:MAG: hypothetical protein K2N33_01515 [Clostridia bacterium]|nr:hypothetical protein [Clostridia bacterium]
MIAMFALFFIGLTIFYFLEIKLHKKLIVERTAELEKKYCDMPFEDAKRILKENEVISDTGFLVSEKIAVFNKEEITFENARLVFDIIQLASHIELSIVLFAGDSDMPKAVYDFDCAMCNFIQGKNLNIINFEDFELFIKDKRAFAQLVLKDAKTFKFINREKF